MNKVAVTELGYVGFGVKDLEAWKYLITEIFGMEWSASGDAVDLRLDYWHRRITLHPGDEEDMRYAGFRVAGPEEFRLMQQQLKDLGVSFEVGSAVDAEARSVLEVLRLKDPAGVPLEIFHGPRVDRHQPFRPGRGMHGRFVTGAEGLGHIVIRDHADSYRFYTQVLGMHGSVEMITELVGRSFTTTFVDCNRRDHTVAFCPLPIEKNVHHLMVEVDNIDDVGLAYDLVQKAKIPITATFGRHSNDEMISFYIESPSGFFLEYGCGGSAAATQSEYNVRDAWGHDYLRL